ncbi:ParA family protein [Candidatus Woesearchaeota archaeon]|jgi:chromosome partitioning protein|nr:ParA family protein [Candidatus Woesearchaeota archaeon]
MRKICIINQKGGVGKTTTTVNLGAGLSRKNRRVLLIDLDPQGHISTCFNDQSHKDMYDFLIENAHISECIKSLGTNFDMITSKESLTSAEVQIHQMDNKEGLLKRKLNEFNDIIKKYDYILIDCPPSIGILAQNGILASTEAIIPTTCDYLGYSSTKTMIGFIEHLGEKYDHDISVTKIVPSMFDSRCQESNDILMHVMNDYYEKVADPIRNTSKIKEAPKCGQSIFKYAKTSSGAEDYQRLVNSVIYDERKYKIEDRAELEEAVDDTEEYIEERIVPKATAKARATAKASMRTKVKKAKKKKGSKKIVKKKPIKKPAKTKKKAVKTKKTTKTKKKESKNKTTKTKKTVGKKETKKKTTKVKKTTKTKKEKTKVKKPVKKVIKKKPTKTGKTTKAKKTVKKTEKKPVKTKKKTTKGPKRRKRSKRTRKKYKIQKSNTNFGIKVEFGG